MTIKMRRSLFTMAAFGVSAALAAAQAPVEPIIAPFQETLKLPAANQDKKDEKKKVDPPKKEEPKAPPVLPVVPSTTLPAGMAPPLGPVAAASTLAAVSSLPPVYGDWLAGHTYSPYIVATTPTGMMSQVPTGDVALFPIGTTFDRPVNTQIVNVVVGTRTVIDPITQRPIQVPILEPRLHVVGPPAIANKGGVPVNVIRGSMKICENESPRPIDRFYVSYNYFSDVNPSLSVPGLPITNVHRETLGLEKTFLEGNASAGIRLPLLQVSGAQNIEAQCLGDISMIFKYALLNEDANNSSVPGGGNVTSIGLVVTAPTGNTGAYSSDVPLIHSTVLQPFLGIIRVRGDWFAQGFSSVAVPTDSRDTTYWFNSLQFGYLLYQAPDSGRFLTSVTPILEVHVNTPLNNRGLTRLPIGAIDVVNFTGGVTLGLGSRSYLNLGTNTPTSGPQPYAIEAIAQLNIRY